MISRLNNILYCTSNADLAGTDVGVDAEELERGEESNLLLLRASLLHSATHSISLYVHTLSTLTKNKIYLCRNYSNKMEFSDF